MRSKTPSTSVNDSEATEYLPSVWNTAKRRSLGRKILALQAQGLMPSPIADRLRKSEAVVRHYLREAGLLPSSRAKVAV